MCPGRTRRFPTICMLLSSLFQESVSVILYTRNFTINVFLFQNVSITEQNVVINVLESSGLGKPEELIVDKSILNSV